VQNLIDAYGSDYDADDIGGVVLLDRDNTDDDAYELFGRTWVEGLYEGVTYDEPSRCYLTCVLFNNEEGVTITEAAFYIAHLPRDPVNLEQKSVTKLSEPSRSCQRACPAS
jgi:hypothetical protein